MFVLFGKQMLCFKSLLFVVCVMAALTAAKVLTVDSSSSSSEFQMLDLHLKLSAEVSNYIEGGLSDQINQLCPHNEIDFNKTIPHVTMYLTEYIAADISDVVRTVDALVPDLAKKIGDCRIAFGDPFAQGEYFMWKTKVPACMQKLADNLTMELAKYRNPSQEVPDWVYELPEPERSNRIEFVKKYGSPNVFQYFSPHVTLAWSDQDDLTKLLTLNYPKFVFKVEKLGLGTVGDHGSVIRGKDVAQWTF